MRPFEEKLPKIATAGAWKGLPQRFPFRKPRKMVQFTVDPRLDCYELAGPMPTFHYDEFLDIEEPQPYVEREREQQPVMLTAREADNRQLEAIKHPNNFSAPKLKHNPKSFAFCGAAYTGEKEIVHNSTHSPRKQIINPNVTNSLGCLSCNPVRQEIRTDDSENRCPHCQNCIQAKQPAVDTHNKRQFWQAWLAERESTGRLPSSSFEDNYKHFREKSIVEWQRHIRNIFH